LTEVDTRRYFQLFGLIHFVSSLQNGWPSTDTEGITANNAGADASVYSEQVRDAFYKMY
jgi:hypothetical protein